MLTYENTIQNLNAQNNNVLIHQTYGWTCLENILKENKTQQ
jgi:hypothetical protein